MKKFIFGFICLALAAGAGARENAAQERHIREGLERARTEPCITTECYDEAVLVKNFPKIKNTLRHASLERTARLLRRGVKVKDRVITAPEYFIAEGAAFAQWLDLLPMYVLEYRGDKARWGDNLLEKLSLSNNVPGQMTAAERIASECGVEAVSERTLRYAAAQAVNKQGLDYLKFVAGKKRASFSAAQRDAVSYPMPYAMQEGDVCSVISARMQAAPEGVFWLREAKKLLQCPPFVHVRS